MTERPDTQRKKHAQYQSSYFDKHCDIFRQPIPEEIQARTRLIVEKSGIGAGSRVLDVGTGMGVLIQYFLNQGVKESDIVGCDLSTNMLQEARAKFPQATFWQGDILEFPEEFAPFDAVFFNACFGNIFDQSQALTVCQRILKPGGRIIISHPMGNRFVESLQEQDPQLVLRRLPTEEFLQSIASTLPMTLQMFTDEPELYLAIMQKRT